MVFDDRSEPRGGQARVAELFGAPAEVPEPFRGEVIASAVASVVASAVASEIGRAARSIGRRAGRSGRSLVRRGTARALEERGRVAERSRGERGASQPAHELVVGAERRVLAVARGFDEHQLGRARERRRAEPIAARVEGRAEQQHREVAERRTRGAAGGPRGRFVGVEHRVACIEVPADRAAGSRGRREEPRERQRGEFAVRCRQREVVASPRAPPTQTGRAGVGVATSGGERLEPAWSREFEQGEAPRTFVARERRRSLAPERVVRRHRAVGDGREVPRRGGMVAARARALAEPELRAQRERFAIARRRDDLREVALGAGDGGRRSVEPSALEPETRELDGESRARTGRGGSGRSSGGSSDGATGSARERRRRRKFGFERLEPRRSGGQQRAFRFGLESARERERRGGVVGGETIADVPGSRVRERESELREVGESAARLRGGRRFERPLGAADRGEREPSETRERDPHGEFPSSESTHAARGRLHPVEFGRTGERCPGAPGSNLRAGRRNADAPP